MGFKEEIRIATAANTKECERGKSMVREGGKPRGSWKSRGRKCIDGTGNERSKSGKAKHEGNGNGRTHGGGTRSAIFQRLVDFGFVHFLLQTHSTERPRAPALTVDRHSLLSAFAHPGWDGAFVERKRTRLCSRVSCIRIVLAVGR